MRLFALITGLILLSLGGYVVIGEHFAGVTANAEINARLTMLRAPIDGKLTLKTAGIGSRVWADEVIGTIEDERIDTTRLADLQQAENTLVSDLDRLEAQRKILQLAQKNLHAHAQTYKKGRIQQLDARIAEAESLKDAATVRLREHNAALERANNLSERGVQTAANLERAKAAKDVAEEELKGTDQRLTFLKIELEAARNDTFLGDSYNDAPYSMQRIREIELRLGEMNAERQTVATRLAKAREQISAEQQRLNRLRSAELRSPINGLVWDYRANTGEVVGRGSELVRLVDCNSVMITASVGEQLYNRLKQGDAAQFRLLGSDAVFEATVTRLAGAGAETIYQNLAIAPSKEHLKRYDVTLVAPALRTDDTVSCAVGRTGRVVFSGGPVEAVRRLIAGLR